MQSPVPAGRTQPSALAAAGRPRFETPIQILRRRKWWVLTTMAIAMTIIGSIVLALPKRYQATATVSVERSHVPETIVRPAVTSGVASRLDFLNRQILNHDRLAQLIQDFDLYPMLRHDIPLSDLVNRMQADIELEAQEQSTSRRGSREATTFTLSYRGDDPHKVADVTNRLVSFYIEENVKVRSQHATSTTEFLQDQLGKIRHQLEQQELQLSQFKGKHIGELPEQLPANIAALEQLKAQLRLNTDKRSRMNEQRAVLLRQLAQAQRSTGTTTAPEVPNTSALKLAELYQNLASLQTQYSAKHPDVISTKTKIQTLQEQLSAEPPLEAQAVEKSPVNALNAPEVLPINDALRSTNFDIKASVAEETNLLRSIAIYQQRVDNAPRREQELQGLLRDYETTQKLYRGLLTQQEQAKLAASLEQRQQSEQFRVLDPATPPKQAASPQRPQLLLGGLLLSLMLGIGVAVTVEKRDQSFHVVEDLRHFSPIPILGSLPQIVTKSDVRRQRWRFSLVAASLIIGLGVLAVSIYTLTSGEFPPINFPSELQSLSLPLRGLLGS